MFRKLRNRLILINLGITSFIIVVVFTMIYVVTTRPVPGRPPMPEAASNDLLMMLVISGVAIEAAVAIISYFLAEEAIKPVKNAYESQKIFIANASHEIKTPLAAIAANLEAADIHDNRFISNVEHETEKLTALNAELLTLARTDIVREKQVEEVDAKEMIQNIIQNLTPRMKNLTFSKKIVLPQKIKINRGDFEQVLNILLDNAIKYAESKIILEASEHKIVVKNDGAKISDAALPHVFERFYQADKTSEGVGLGLSIAKSLCDRNNWKIAAASDNKYTTFTLSF